jgi:hypothetical protein
MANGNGHGPAQQEHGVPRPPEFGGRPQGNVAAAPNGEPGRAANAAAPGEAHQPMWTQPHAPIATRSEPNGQQYGMQQPREAAHGQPQPEHSEAAPGRPAQAAFEREPQGQQQQARPEAQPQRGFEPQAQTRPAEPQQARPEARPQPQPQPPREVSRPQEQPQQRAEYHPQPQPQPQPQQHAEPPHPQEQRANRGHDEQKHS